MTKPRDPSWIYFIRRADGEGPVKIGCSGLLEHRVVSLMAWSPYKLAIFARYPGDLLMERRFHGLFSASWSHGEWFAPSPEMERVIEQINAGEFDPAILPAPWHPLSKRTGSRWTEGQKLRTRLSMLRNRSGIGCYELLVAAEQYERLSPEEQRRLAERIAAHIRNPLAVGEILPYEWAYAKYAKFAAKHGLPPLVTQAVA